ncbi:MAG TPA: phosphatase PAP2 family protein [Longimicrobiales bacterium]
MKAFLIRLHQRDELVLLYVIGYRTGRLDRAVRRFTHLGGPTIAIGATAAMLLSPSPVWHGAGRHAAIALAGSHLVVQLIKRSVCRARPRLPVGIHSLIDAPDRFSFPSGHAAAALSVALGASVAVPAAAPWLLGAALAVGLSRCYLGVHYPGDVLAGWILAAAAFLAAILV